MILSVLSVISVFFIYNVQVKGEYYSEESDNRVNLMALIDIDVEKVLDEDQQFYEAALIAEQEFLDLDDLIKRMKWYNSTCPSVNYTVQDYEEIALQAVTKIERINRLTNKTIAYGWTLYNGGNSSNNYSLHGRPFYLVYDAYPVYESSLDPDLKRIINDTYYPQKPQMLLIAIPNWRHEMHNDTSIFGLMKTQSYMYGLSLGINLNETSVYNLMNESAFYSAKSDIYEQATNIMTTSLILLAIGAVIIAFVVSIDIKKYIVISLILGLVVATIACYTFILAFIYI